MIDVIGMGSHALDILETIQHRRIYRHHTEYHGKGPVLIAINDPQTRAQVAWELGVPDVCWIHPEAYLGPHCFLGAGTHINYMASLTRTRTGKHCTISPGATICGDVEIGSRVLIGAGATICDRVTIESDVIVAAGAVVPPTSYLREGRTYIGVPAKCS